MPLLYISEISSFWPLSVSVQASLCQTWWKTTKTGLLLMGLILYEPPRGKTNKVVSEQVGHKPACAVTEDG